MKDEFDDVTPDMLVRSSGKKVSRPNVGQIESMINAEEGSSRSEKVKNLKSTTQPGGQLNPLNNIISRLDEEGNRPAKAPARPFPRGGGSSGTGGAAADNKMLLNPRAMKKGGKVAGKVAGKLATRGYGKAR